MSDDVFEIKKEAYLEARENHLLADRFDKTHTAAEALECDIDLQVKTAGRITAFRKMGKAFFARVFDSSATIQIYMNKTEAGEEVFKAFLDQVSIGDFVGVEGKLFCTRTGEKTINASAFTLLNKCLRTLPEKFHGITDPEVRYRQRYLDFVMNEETRDVLMKRIKTIQCIRQYLESDGYVEVETPILQTLISGALARPFVTHHNALDMDCNLRISCETFLKRAIGAGIDKVYEFARTFRNEGISPNHLQDFTMLEFYGAYQNADDQRAFVTGMFKDLIEKVFGQMKINLRGHEIDFGGDWPTYTLAELIQRDAGIDIMKAGDRDQLLAAIKEKGIKLDEDLSKVSWANLVDLLYKKVSRPNLIQPCFVVQYPVEMAPLARKNQEDGRFVDLFQFLVAGVELVKAYSELVDPLDQRERFEQQMEARRQGDEETMPLDEDFLLAMEHGFPPVSGVGIGIDRLVMVLCGQGHIKDAVFFPLMRPE